MVPVIRDLEACSSDLGTVESRRGQILRPRPLITIAQPRGLIVWLSTRPLVPEHLLARP